MRPVPVSAAALALALASSLVLTFGCGGGSAPPLTPDNASTATKDAGPESFGEVNPADLAELDAGSSATPPSAATPSAPEPKDECTPVGVDFEKRARPKLKDCYATGKKKDANLQGTVKISVDIDIYGKVKTFKIVEKTLPEPVAQCMLKAIKATPLPEATKCPGKSLTIPVTFPTPR
jgi:hypothetical protein